MVLGTVTPAVSTKIASAFGMDANTVQRLLGMAVPVVLSGILGASRKPEAADSFGQAFRDMGDNPLDSLNDALATDPSRVAGAGSGMLGSILGDGMLGTLVSKVAGVGGMSQENSGALMGLAGSLAMGSLGKAARDQNLDAAGALKMLEGQKDSIAAAIPADLAGALAGTGVLEGLGDAGKPAATAAKPEVKPAAPAPKPAPKPAPAPEPQKSGLTKWLLLAAAALLLIWLVPRFLGGSEETPEPVVETAPATEETAPATEEAAPATEEAAPVEEAAPAVEEAAPTDAAESAAPEMPAMPDVFATIDGALAQLGTTLSGVTDAASADAALPQLQDVDATLAAVEGDVEALPADVRGTLQSSLASAMPTIRSTVDGLMANPEVSGVIQPVVDSIMTKLAAYAG